MTPAERMAAFEAEVDAENFDPFAHNGNAPAEENPLEARLLAVRFDLANPPPEEPVVFSVAGTPVSHAGNLATIEAHQKSGKSAFVGAGIASIFARDEADCLGWSSNKNPLNYAVLHFDCEQSPRQHYGILQRAIARSAVDTVPSWLDSFCLTGWSCLDMRAAFSLCVKNSIAKFGGVHSLWLDGVADPVSSPNEEVECFAFVRWLQLLAKDNAFPILGILHLNPGIEGKSRGHLGSELNRKSESVLRITKDENEVSTVASSWSRGPSIPKSLCPSFAWSDAENRHVSVANSSPENAKMVSLEILAREVFRSVPSSIGLTWTQLHEAIEQLEKCSRSTSKRRVEEFQKWKIIRYGNDKYFWK